MSPNDEKFDVPTRRITDEAASTTWDNAGGAKRSSPMLPWFMLPLGAIRGMLTRFKIGLKYGVNNWKRALGTPRERWHDGEPGPGLGDEDKSTLGFVRQFQCHQDEHWFQASRLMDKPAGAVSPKGDTLADNLFAELWNCACKVEYFLENEDLFREAFSQWPVDSPFHRLDRIEPVCGQTSQGCQDPGAKEPSEPNKQLGPIPALDPSLERLLMKTSLERYMYRRDTRVVVGDFEIIRVR